MEFMGLVPAEPAQHKDAGSEYPKWVEPHHSHVHHDAMGEVSVAGFDFHIDRATRKVTVLVHNFTEEAKATAPKPAEEAKAD
jgi:hypothetical protein